MTDTNDADDIGFSPRDIAILKARIKYPTASVRELQETLDEEYDISLSHNRVNEILRELKSEGLFRLFAAPAMRLFEYHLFRVSFHYPSFEERWEDCHADLVRDPHVILFFTAEDYHQWQFITQFRTDEDSEEWKLEFFQKHGDIIAEFDKTSLPSVHKFDIDAAIFDDVLQEHDEGEQFLESNL
ncbi:MULTISPECIES: helix-turn-helix domain-containing protein [Salinibaculum]|uniref:helix-turn-helix domain-containing protein n=1 Tax=Salinibaculum TaxID=2732368 RepID=UPI0030CCBCB8